MFLLWHIILKCQLPLTRWQYDREFRKFEWWSDSVRSIYKINISSWNIALSKKWVAVNFERWGHRWCSSSRNLEWEVVVDLARRECAVSCRERAEQFALLQWKVLYMWRGSMKDRTSDLYSGKFSVGFRFLLMDAKHSSQCKECSGNGKKTSSQLLHDATKCKIRRQIQHTNIDSDNWLGIASTGWLMFVDDIERIYCVKNNLAIWVEVAQ